MDDPIASERFRAAADLAGLSSGFEALFQVARSPFLVVTPPDYTIIAVNDAYLRTTMTERAAIVGKPLFEVFPDNPDDASADGARQLRASLERVVATRRLDEMPVTRYPITRFASPGGELDERWWAPRNAPILGPDGAVAGILHHAEDVTDRLRVKAALDESEAKYRNLFDSIDIGFCTVEVLFDERARPVDYRFLQVNPAFERQTGIQNAQGRRMHDIAARHEQHWFETCGRVALTGEPVRFIDEAAQFGRWFDVFAFRVDDPQLRHVGILFNDITERRRAENALRASQEELNAYVNATSDTVYKMSADWREMHYLAGKGFIATTLAPRGDWTEEYIPDDEKPRVRASIQHAIDTRGTFELEHRVVRLDGTIGWIFSRAIPRFDEGGRIIQWFGAASDITERKRDEEALRRSEGDLRVAVDERDELLKELHHRVKNNLQVVTSLLEMQGRRTADREALSSLAEARNRITAIAAIHELLYQTGSFSEVDLAAYARRLLRHVVTLYDAGARIDAAVTGDGIAIDLARAVPLGLLLNELVSNAYKHAFPSGAGGSLRLALRREGDHILLRVQDTGIGLPDGFETRSTTTLGLELVRLLVKQLGGTVTFASAGGTTVEVRVPVRGKPG